MIVGGVLYAITREAEYSSTWASTLSCPRYY